MKWTKSGWIAVTLFAGAGFTALYAGLRRNRRLVLAERQAEADVPIAALATAFEALEGELAEAKSFAKSDPSQGEVPAAPANAADQQDDPVKPETLAVLTAAATAFLGKTTLVRSATSAPPAQETVSPWSQQGRMMVESSHNLRPGDARRP
jgi:hypothetical protein